MHKELNTFSDVALLKLKELLLPENREVGNQWRQNDLPSHVRAPKLPVILSKNPKYVLKRMNVWGERVQENYCNFEWPT